MSTIELPQFPGENPIPTEKERWFKEADRIADTTEAGFLLRAETPPSLQQYALARDTSALTQVVIPSGDAVRPESILAAIKHNDYVAKETNNEATRVAAYKQGCIKIQRAWAAALSKALSETAPLLLAEAEEANKINNVDGSFDGIGMHKLLRQGRTDVDAGSRRLTFGLWHKKKYTEMFETKLPDRCTTEEFTEKWNRFNKDHLPHFVTINMDDEQMARAMVGFLPATLRRDGDALLREFARSKKLQLGVRC